MTSQKRHSERQMHANFCSIALVNKYTKKSSINGNASLQRDFGFVDLQQNSDIFTVSIIRVFVSRKRAPSVKTAMFTLQNLTFNAIVQYRQTMTMLLAL